MLDPSKHVDLFDFVRKVQFLYNDYENGMMITSADHLLEAGLLRETQVVHALDMHAVDTRQPDGYIHVDRSIQHVWFLLHRLTIKLGLKKEGLT